MSVQSHEEKIQLNYRKAYNSNYFVHFFSGDVMIVPKSVDVILQPASHANTFNILPIVISIGRSCIFLLTCSKTVRKITLEDCFIVQGEAENLRRPLILSSIFTASG